VLCEAQRAALAARMEPSRVHVIPHGVDTAFFTPGPPREPGGGLRLLSVGHWLRDHQTAFSALAMLRAQGVPASLRLITPQVPSVLPEDVSVESGLSDEALREAYRSADALLLPLADATANNAVLEAMACGLPVVSTDVGGVGEMTAGAALLAPPGDAAALAAHLLALARSEDLALRLARAGRARAESLDWRIIAARYAALYAALAGARP
jgi:glycosyltransferase involved in cell wall biosynthesis